MTPEERRAYNAKRQREWRAKNPPSIRAYRTSPKGRAVHAAQQSRRRETLREEVTRAYGGRCTCCGESEPLFLTLDHVNGDGAAHRRTLSTDRSAIYRWAKSNDYPPTLQILCANCHLAKDLRGGCPHRTALCPRHAADGG